MRGEKLQSDICPVPTSHLHQVEALHEVLDLLDDLDLGLLIKALELDGKLRLLLNLRASVLAGALNKIDSEEGK